MPVNLHSVVRASLIAVLAVGLVPVAASAALPTTLDGEGIQLHISDDLAITSGTCSPSGPSTFTFNARGDASGPYVGVFHESGTFTIASPDGPLTSFDATITLSRTLLAPTDITIRQRSVSSTNVAKCLFEAPPFLNQRVNFDAVIDYTLSSTPPIPPPFLEAGTAFVTLNYNFPRAFFADFSANTPVGAGPTVVTPVDARGATPVTLTFTNVTQAGDTTLNISSSGPPAPTGFSLTSPIEYFNISTAALYDSVVVCITDPLVHATPPPSQLLHYSGATATNVTAPPPPTNPDGFKICSIPLTSLSPFVIATATGGGPPVANAGADQVVQETGAATHVTLDGSLSSSPSGSALTYLWTEGLSSLAAGQVVDVALAFGAHPITLTVTDSAGLSSTAQVLVTIIDTIPPAITCPPATTAECTGSASANVAPGTAWINDPGDPVTVTGYAAGSYPLGTTTLTYTARDQAGNVSSCSSTITVIDTIPPTIICPAPVTAECTGNGAANVTPGSASASDFCTSATVVAAPAGGSYPLGTSAVTYVASDQSGNRSSCASSITVVDTTPPGITCGARQILECSAPGGATGTPTATCSDSCGSCSVSCTSALFPPGTSNGSCSAQDLAGNRASCIQQITVVDTTPPSIAVTASPAILRNREDRLVHITITTTVSDVCDPVPLVTCVATSNEPVEKRDRKQGDDEEEESDIVWRNGQLYLSAERNPHGQERLYTITCTAMDASGNSSSAVALVKVTGEDSEHEGNEGADGDR